MAPSLEVELTSNRMRHPGATPLHLGGLRCVIDLRSSSNSLDYQQTGLTSASDMKKVRLRRQKPGFTISVSSSICFLIFMRALSGIDRRRMAYGPAH